MPRCACGAELPIHPAPHRLPVLLEHLPVPVGAVLLPGDGDDRVAPTGRAGHHGELVVEMEIGRASCRERGWIWGGGGLIVKKNVIVRGRCGVRSEMRQDAS